MQLIKSLFCWRGFDNRPRFIVIGIICFLAFILLNEKLNDFKLSIIIILLLCSFTCLAATRRRLNDAQLDKKWLLAPAGSFFFSGLIVIFTGHVSSYWLLLIPLLMMLLLLTYPSKSQKQYRLGYNGPINLSDYHQVKKANSRNSQRVEPTINSINVNQTPVNKNHYSPFPNSLENASSTTNRYQANNKPELGESIRLVLFKHKSSRLTIVAIIFLSVLALLISLIFSTPTPTEPVTEHTSDIQEITKGFQHQLTLPDNFSIMITANQAFVVHWQGNIKSDHEVWALATAEGDKSCETIVFNNGETIRSYSVSTMDSGYYAYFSPLDTKALIKNIAFKSKFSLCGYKFSLKGSQATLGKSTFYANLIAH